MMRIKDKYISPFTEFGFKKLFGTEPNKDIFMDFLSKFLKEETGKILDCTIILKQYRQSCGSNLVLHPYIVIGLFINRYEFGFLA